MPPDRVFGRIKKCLRKEEIIVSPHQYYDVFKKFSTVYVLNKDYVIYDIKNIIKTFMKPNVIKTTEQKVFTYYKGIKTVNVSSNYEDNLISTYTISVLKRGTSLNTLDKRKIYHQKLIMSSLQNKKMLKMQCNSLSCQKRQKNFIVTFSNQMKATKLKKKMIFLQYILRTPLFKKM